MDTDDVLVSLPASIEDGPERTFERSENAKMVTEALDKLTQDQREAIVLARYHEMSHAEIALIAGCSVGAVKTRIFRGMEAMRGLLTPKVQGKAPAAEATEATEATPAEETPVEETNV
jgi:RNA polymerase sigma-70 factor (ECF subfamily)